VRKLIEMGTEATTTLEELREEKHGLCRRLEDGRKPQGRHQSS
jgi:hypothetical protein